MSKNEQPDLASLPLLTMRRVLQLADCSRSTLQRASKKPNGPKPVGRRGRTAVYRTSDVIAWLTSDTAGPATTPVEPLRTKRSEHGGSSSEALKRVASIARGDGEAV